MLIAALYSAPRLDSFDGGRLPRRKPRFALPEIIGDEENVGWRSRLAVEVGIDHPAARGDGGVVAEIVGGLEHEPGHLRGGRFRFRFGGSHGKAIACGGAE